MMADDPKRVLSPEEAKLAFIDETFNYHLNTRKDMYPRAEDARLIAAAPDLLEACKAAFSLMCEHLQGSHPRVPPVIELADVMERLAAAVAKAEVR